MEIDKPYEPGTNLGDHMSTGKQGHVLYNCCCDSRRGVIVMNIIMMVLSVLTTILILAGVEIVENINTDTIDDDQKRGQIEDAQEKLNWGVVTFAIIMNLISIFVCALGIYGARDFKLWPIYTAFGWYCFGIIVNSINLNISGLILLILGLYPHWIFIKELRHGIMSPETYDRERQSCCCV